MPKPLLESDLDPDPLRQFARWFEEAKSASRGPAEAMALATATEDGVPSVRMVLLKDFDERGFVFHTGYESRKGRELAANPRAALLFHWQEQGRQARIEGSVERVSPEESDAYYLTRPLGSRLAAWASPQSEPISGREELDARVEELRVRFAEQAAKRPPSWGGYRVSPETYEFWQHRDDRLHDRFRYRRGDGGWLIERLAP